MHKHTRTLNESKQPPTRPIPTHCPPTHPHTYLDSGCVCVCVCVLIGLCAWVRVCVWVCIHGSVVVCVGVWVLV